MNKSLSRRSFMKAAGGAAAGVSTLGLPAFARLAAAQDAITMRLAWWGGDARHAMYNTLADMYQALNPSITLEREFAAWGPYWEKLAIDTAGGNAPDIIHMHQTFLSDYATRGALMDLGPFVESGQIDLTHFQQGIIDTGKINDTIYMITLGNSAPGVHYNTVIFEENGLDFPEYAWNWDDFKATALALREVLPPEMYAVNDAGAWLGTLETYIRQRGYFLFAQEDGKALDQLGFPKEVLVENWLMWDELRQANAITPAELNAEYVDASHPDSMLAKKIIAMHPMSGNQHKLFQNAMEDPIRLTTIPRGTQPDSLAGDVVGGAYLSMSATTANVDAVADFINWMINNPEVARVYNAEHGPPGSTEMQALIADQLDPADVRLAEMMAFIGPTASPEAPRPANGTEALNAIARFYDQVAFGQISVEEAVDLYFEEADFILTS